MLNREEIEKRISTTNEAGLVAILYEALIENFRDSMVAIEEEGFKELNHINRNSRDILAELLATLEGDSKIAQDLRSIYMFLNKIITDGENKKDKIYFEKAIDIVTPLYEGFRELEKNRDPKVVTGMTYGKNNLDDYPIEGSKTFEG